MKRERERSEKRERERNEKRERGEKKLLVFHSLMQVNVKTLSLRFADFYLETNGSKLFLTSSVYLERVVFKELSPV